jgi:hypothetical protein
MNKPLMLVVSLLWAGCVEDMASIQIQYVIGGQPTPECTISTGSEQKVLGIFDLGYAFRRGTLGYIAALQVKNNAEATALTGGGGTTNPASRNDFYFEEAVLSYSGAGVSIGDETQVISGMVAAGADGFAAVDLVPLKVAEKLKGTASVTGNPDGLLLTVRVRLRGKYAHGASLETAPLAFPMRVIQSTPPVCCGDYATPPASCVAGVSTVMPDGATLPCGIVGMDGTYLLCVASASP